MHLRIVCFCVVVHRPCQQPTSSSSVVRFRRKRFVKRSENIWYANKQQKQTPWIYFYLAQCATAGRIMPLRARRQNCRSAQSVNLWLRKKSFIPANVSSDRTGSGQCDWYFGYFDDIVVFCLGRFCEKGWCIGWQRSHREWLDAWRSCFKTRQRNDGCCFCGLEFGRTIQAATKQVIKLFNFQVKLCQNRCQTGFTFKITTWKDFKTWTYLDSFELNGVKIHNTFVRISLSCPAQDWHSRPEHSFQ